MSLSTMLQGWLEVVREVESQPGMERERAWLKASCQPLE
jgi:hypothetical protein